MTTPAGAAMGGIRVLLRAEGLVVLVLALVLFAETSRSWWLFAGLLLAPDLAILGYLAGPRIGAAAYNAVHSYIGPLALALLTRGEGIGFALAVIWLAHCGMDRAGGYGLKYSTAFGHTHLGKVGR